MMRLRKRLAGISLFAITLAIPMLASIATHSYGYAAYAAYSGNAARGVTAAVVGTIVNVGWATGLLCGVQLVVGLVLAG